MPHVHSLNWTTNHLRPFFILSRLKQQRLTLSFAVAGALAFWLPDVSMHLYAGHDLESKHVLALTILAPATFLLAYLVARRFAVKRNFQWPGGAMFVGVMVTGGLFTTLAATASGIGLLAPHGIRDSLVMIVLSIVPGFTYLLAAFDGSLLALLVLTLGALTIWGARASWMLVSSSSSPTKLADHNQLH